MQGSIKYGLLFTWMLLIWLTAFPQQGWMDSLKSVIGTQKEDTNKVWTLVTMADHYASSNPDSGLLLAKRALTLSEKLQYDKGIFWSRVSIDRSLYISGNYVLELENALKAVPVAQKLNDRYATGWSNGMICDSYLGLGDYTTAMTYIRVIMKNIEQFYPDELFSGYAALVPVYVGLHKADSALLSANKSYALLKGMPSLYHRNATDSKRAKSQVYLSLGQGFEATGNYDSALMYYHLSIPFSDEINIKINKIDAYRGLVKCYAEQWKPDSAIYYGTKIFEDKLIHTYPAAKLKAANLLADIYEKQNNSDSSLKYLRMAVNLKERIFSHEKTTAFQNSILDEREKQKQIQVATIALKDRYRMYFAIAFIALAIIVIGFIIRSRRIKQLENIRNSIAHDLHDDIGSTLSSISIMSELARQKSPLALPLLTSIGESTTAIQENMSDIVWAVNPENDRFECVLQRMNMFASEILEAKNMELDFITDPSLATYRFTMKQRKNLYLFFKEAINNAAKYSNAEKISTHISKRNGHIELIITDNGKGFDTSCAFNGNGMNTFKKRAKELNAHFQCMSKLNEGTTVQLKFKIT